MTTSSKTALVTGASRGIGRATAVALAKSGARVLVHFVRNAEKAAEVVAEIRGDGGSADAVQADLAGADGIALLRDRVCVLGEKRLDILVCNAGIARAAKIAEQKMDDFDQLFATNVRAPFFILQSFLPLLVEGSSVILLSSLAGHAVPGSPGQTGTPAISAYAATKGAVDSLVRHWASALGPAGIRVNAVAPGVIETDMGQSLKTEAGRHLTLSLQALKRIGQPPDVADVIAFLASDKARWITGAIIPVDGGARL